MRKNLQTILVYTMVSIGCLSYVSCVPITSENCQFEDLNEIKLPVINRVFADNEDAYLQFEKDFLANRQLALKNWLLSTKTFSDIKSIDDILLAKIEIIGGQNTGVYSVGKQNNPEQKFILKIGTSTEEAPKLFRLQQSIAAKPECLIQSKIFSGKKDMEKALEFFPKIIKIYEAANHSVKNENGLIKHLQLSLLEEASGQVIYSFHNGQSATEAYRAAGKSTGYFHYLLAINPEDPFTEWITWKHGDLHSFNIFYNPDLKNITFIDNDGMKSNQKIDEFGRDFERSAYMFFYRSLNGGYSPIRFYLATLIEKEAQRQGKFVANINYHFLLHGYLDPLSVLINALNNLEVQTQVIQTDAFKEISTTFNHFSVFVQGYLEAMPEEKRPEVRAYFANLCRKASNAFLSDYNYITDEVSNNSKLEKAIRTIFPKNFLDCIDNGHF